MKTTITFIISICFLTTLNAQTKIEILDFKNLDNTNWKGTLLYKNYSDGKEVVLQTTMKIIVKNNKVITEIKFPGEPKANSKNTVKIKKNGRFFGNEEVIEKAVLENGTIKMVTFYEGKDNNEKAKMYKTYLFNTNTFSITKEVVYVKSGEKIIRNKQTYKRI